MSESRVLGIMRVPDRPAQLPIELVAVDDDLLGMDGLDRAERDREIAGILDVDDQFRSPVGPDLANSTEGLVVIRDEHLEALLDWLIGHRRLLHAGATVLAQPGPGKPSYAKRRRKAKTDGRSARFSPSSDMVGRYRTSV